MANLSDMTVGSAEEGVWMDILNPLTNALFKADEGGNVRVLLLGSDSSVYQKHQHQISNRRIKSALARQRGSGPVITSEEAEDEEIIGISKAIKNWENIQWEGEDLICNEKNAILILTKVPWLKEQIQSFLEDRTNFLCSSNSNLESMQNGVLT